MAAACLVIEGKDGTLKAETAADLVTIGGLTETTNSETVEVWVTH